MASKTEIGSIELLAVDAQLIFLNVKFIRIIIIIIYLLITRKYQYKFPLHCDASRSVLISTSIICTKGGKFLKKLWCCVGGSISR